MLDCPTISNLAHPFSPVKSTINTVLIPSSNSMIHHKSPLSRNKKTIVSYNNYGTKPYGVSRSRRVLSPQLLFKKFDNVRDSLEYVLGLSPAQREVTLRLLRIWAYYGQVYPKEAQITQEPGCSKATFWRTIKLLEDMGMLTRINRFVIRPHAQISNLYRFDKLLIVLARYLAEHGVAFWQKWLTPVLTMPGRLFWSQVFQSQGISIAPSSLAYSGP